MTKDRADAGAEFLLRTELEARLFQKFATIVTARGFTRAEELQAACYHEPRCAVLENYEIWMRALNPHPDKPECFGWLTAIFPKMSLGELLANKRATNFFEALADKRTAIIIASTPAVVNGMVKKLGRPPDRRFYPEDVHI